MRIEPVSTRVEQRLFGGQVLGTDNHHDAGLALTRGGGLDDPISQKWVKQDRKDENHEQGATVAELVEDLAAENHVQVRPAHESVSSSMGKSREVWLIARAGCAEAGGAVQTYRLFRGLELGSIDKIEE